MSEKLIISPPSAEYADVSVAKQESAPALATPYSTDSILRKLEDEYNEVYHIENKYAYGIADSGKDFAEATFIAPKWKIMADYFERKAQLMGLEITTKNIAKTGSTYFYVSLPKGINYKSFEVRISDHIGRKGLFGNKYDFSDLEQIKNWVIEVPEIYYEHYYQKEISYGEITKLMLDYKADNKSLSGVSTDNLFKALCEENKEIEYYNTTTEYPKSGLYKFTSYEPVRVAKSGSHIYHVLFSPQKKRYKKIHHVKELFTHAEEHKSSSLRERSEQNQTEGQRNSHLPSINTTSLQNRKGYKEQQEEKEVKSEDGGEILLAPNGKPSNLTPEQWHLVRTPEFKAWFGDWENNPSNASKVVDENGEPLVVYRGFNKKSDRGNVFKFGVNRFKENRLANRFAHYFTRSKNVAVEYSKQSRETEDDIIVKPYFLKSNKILDITSDNPNYPKFEEWQKQSISGLENLYELLDKLEKRQIPIHSWVFSSVINKATDKNNLDELSLLKINEINDKLIENEKQERIRYKENSEITLESLIKLISGNSISTYLDKNEYDNFEANKRREAHEWFIRYKPKDIIVMDDLDLFIKKLMIENNFDGGKFKEFQFGTKTELDKEVYFVFEPNQIKIADGTNTAFDANNPDIRFEDGGGINIKEPLSNLQSENKNSTDEIAEIIEGYEVLLSLETDEKKKKKLALKISILKESIKENKPIIDIKDVGEKIGGAKKDVYKASTNLTEDIYKKNLSELLPRPNFEKLIKENVISKRHAAILDFIYNSIPHKPKHWYRLKKWVEKVEYTINLFKTTIEEHGSDEEKQQQVIDEDVRKEIFTNTDFLIFEQIRNKFGFDFQIPSNIYIKKYSDSYKLIANRIVLKSFENLEDAIDELEKVLSKKTKSQKVVKLLVYQDRTTKEFFIGKKGATGVIRIVEGFSSVNEAFAYLKANFIELQEMWSSISDIPSERKDYNRERIGIDWRNGNDVDAEVFMKTFGFRGVEFGNWVNQNERQTSINDAYDALMDLSFVLGIKPKSISLGGELGLAFGARGSGRFNAHYEPDRVVINLTKTKGAGSVAHEWWHSIDNYFRRKDNVKNKYITEDVLSNSRGLSYSRIRREMIEAFLDVSKSVKDSNLFIRSLTLDKTRANPYWSTIVEMTARCFENYIIDSLSDKGYANDYLANLKSLEDWVKDSKGNIDANKNYPYLLEEEKVKVYESYKNLFNTIEEQEENDKIHLYKDGGVFPEIEDKNILLAPNGKPSNLTPEQWHLVRTPEFKKWFGDWENDLANASKIVDKNGEPEICYHGTFSENINIFDKSKIGENTGNYGHYGYGFYFSFSKIEASTYTSAKNPIILECFLNIRNPFLSSNINHLEKYSKEYDYYKEKKPVAIDSDWLLSELKKHKDKKPYLLYKSIKENGYENGWNLFLEKNKINWAEETFDYNRINDWAEYDSSKEQFSKENEFENNNDEIPEYILEDISNQLKIPVSKIKTIKQYTVGNYPRLLYMMDLGNRSISLTDEIKKDGFDGIIAGSEIVLFKSNQIKLADGTNTTFDGNNLDIRFEDGGEILLAPNGKPSNLTPEQWYLVRTPEFKAWFGDWLDSPDFASKVVDENGEPLVVYHGTLKYGFTVFKSKSFPTTGYFAKDKSFSYNFINAKKRYRDLSQEINEGIYEVFLNIRTPIKFTGIDGYNDLSIEEFITLLPYKIDDFNDTWAKNISEIKIPLISYIANNDIIDSFKRNGYDGIFFNEGNVDLQNKYKTVNDLIINSTESFVAFNPNQIKLADGTNTTFDGNNLDIRFEQGGSVLLAPNGKPSNLAPEQYKLVRTPEFKQWFGDWENNPTTASKVVDENGEPLVLYHGTNYGAIEVFDRLQKKRIDSGLKEFGTYFTTNKKLADFYAIGAKLQNNALNDINRKIEKLKELLYTVRSNREYNEIQSEINRLEENKRPKTYEVFLNIRRIKEFDAKGEEEMRGWQELEVDAGYKIASNRDAMYFLKDGLFGVEKVDGIRAKNIVDAFVQGDKKLRQELIGDVFLLFDGQPQNIKLADGTNTTFDSDNPDIRYAKGGNIYHIYHSVGLEGYLVGKSRNPYIGKELEMASNDYNIRIFHTPEKTDYRFLYITKGKTVSAIHIDTIEGVYVVRNIYTLEDFRRKGYGRKLYNKAKEILKSPIYFSKNLSEAGRAFMSNMSINKENGGEITTREQFFELKPVNNNIEQLSENINYILSIYGSRKMAAMQIEEYLVENKELGKQWLQQNNIKTREQLNDFLANKQVKARSQHHKTRKEELIEANKYLADYKANIAASEIEQLAYKAEEEMQQKIAKLFDGGELFDKDNTMELWHGGNLEEDYNAISHKKGRYEYGAGLYLTSHKETAKKYAKGSRKLYRVIIEKGTEIHEALIDIKAINDFINRYVVASKRKEIKQRISKYISDSGKVKAFLVNNIILNENAITATNSKNLRLFLVENGIDYEIVDNAFGWGETMVVLYNMKKIVSKEIVDKNKYEQGGEILLAPNGKPSNLTAEQYKLVRTPEFKAWFGDWENNSNNASKIVDENGEPLVVYHGSNRDFNIFRSDVGRAHDSGFYGAGFYFTFNIERRWMPMAKSEASYYGRIVKEYFINARTPFDFSQLSSYKGKETNLMGLESMVFLYNIALRFPEIADTIFVKKVEWKDGVGNVTKVPISVLPELVNKYSKDLKIIKIEENITFGKDDYMTGYVKSETVEYDYTATGGKKGSYESTENLGRYQKGLDIREIEIGLIFDAIEKYDGISADYFPEGIMTRNPQITETIKRLNHDAIMQGKYGDELVVFNSNQIKIADGSNTKFNSESNDVRFKDGGKIKNDNLLNELSSSNNFKELKKIASKNYKKIGSGTSRIVYYYTDNFVIKIAKNNKGIEQNKTESNPNILSKHSDIVAKIIDYDENGKWIIQQFTRGITKEIFEKNTGIQLEGFFYYLRFNKIWDGKNKDFYDKVNSLVTAFDLDRFDISNISAWGTIDDKIVLRDYGLTLSTARKLYGVNYEHGGEVLLAHNGKPSNLTAEQYRLVRTPEFKAWFGDWENNTSDTSKLIDENGEPMVLWRSDNNEPIKKEYTFYSPNKNYPKEYMGLTTEPKPYFIKAKKVFDLQNESDFNKYVKYNGSIYDEDSGETYNTYKEFYNGAAFDHNSHHAEEAYNWAIQNGYDAIATYETGIRNILKIGNTDIKLADGTNTTFDSLSNDIRFEQGGEILLTPNGKPSNLTAEQYKLVRTPEFKAWFGDWENNLSSASKVIDENGEPKVMWHGSDAINEITVFKSSRGHDFNFFAEDKWYASTYSIKGEEPKPFFLNAKKIFNPEKINKRQKEELSFILESEEVLKALNGHWAKHQIEYEKENTFGNKSMSDFDFVKNIFYKSEYNWIFLELPIMQNYIKKNGYDGFVTLEGNIGLNIAVYSPNQIKLANGVNTTFNPSSDDVRYSEGGIIAFNNKIKEQHLKDWKSDYERDEDINELVARNYLYAIAKKYYGGVEEIEFVNQSKKPKNYFQMKMYLGNVILATAPFIYVDDNHKVIAKRTKVEVWDYDYETIKSNIKLEDGGYMKPSYNGYLFRGNFEHINDIYELENYSGMGEAGRGVYFFKPSMQMQKYYTKNGEYLIKAKVKEGYRIINLHALRNDFKNWAESKSIKINFSNYQKYAWEIMQYMQQNYPDAIGYIVQHKGYNIPSGYQIVITNLDGLELFKNSKYANGGKISPNINVDVSLQKAIEEVTAQKKYNLSSEASNLLIQLPENEILDNYDNKLSFFNGEVEANDEIVDELYNKGYIEIAENGWSNEYLLTQHGKAFQQAVKARLQTRTFIKQGIDLFPEDANLPKEELKANNDYYYNEIADLINGYEILLDIEEDEKAKRKLKIKINILKDELRAITPNANKPIQQVATTAQEQGVEETVSESVSEVGDGTAETATTVLDPLKDVESTAKALENVDYKLAPNKKIKFENKNGYEQTINLSDTNSFSYTQDDPRQESITIKGFTRYNSLGNKEGVVSFDVVSEAYHKAKADGSNPELVKAVEELLSKKQTQSGTNESKTGEIIPEEVQKQLQNVEEATDFSKAISASSRFKPYEIVVFEKPIVGKNGNKLISYQWAYEWTMLPNWEGELKSKRISDWTQAESSAETGRDIVHKFTVERKDGTVVTVSSETIPSLLGYVDEKEMNNLPSIVSSVKTLAKQRMQLAILKAQEQEYNAIEKQIKELTKPNIIPAEIKDLPKIAQSIASRDPHFLDDVKYWKTDGETTVVFRQENTSNIPDRTTKEQLMWLWESVEIEKKGGKKPRGIYDLERRIERQEKKVALATGSKVKVVEDTLSQKTS